MGIHTKMRTIALSALVGGVSAVLLDADHPLSFALGIEDGRFLHVPAFALVSAAVAFVGGLLLVPHRRDMKDGRN